eukprot:1452162-Amphidinium_carterae.1
MKKDGSYERRLQASDERLEQEFSKRVRFASDNDSMKVDVTEPATAAVPAAASSSSAAAASAERRDDRNEDDDAEMTTRGFKRELSPYEGMEVQAETEQPMAALIREVCSRGGYSVREGTKLLVAAMELQTIGVLPTIQRELLGSRSPCAYPAENCMSLFVAVSELLKAKQVPANHGRTNLIKGTGTIRQFAPRSLVLGSYTHRGHGVLRA